MASPFSYFRKNQRFWMAAAVLIAILSFVVAPMLQSFTGNSQGVSNRPGGNSTAASWTGGSISREQLDVEMGQLSVANMFLKRLAFDVRDKGGYPRVPEVRPDFALVGITPDTRDPSSILERKILAAEANRMGIHFDDQSVRLFLQKFVDGKLSGEQIQKTLKEVSGGRMSLSDFNRLMKEELAKNAVLRLANGGQRYEERANAMGAPTALLNPPSKNWQYFTRFKRRASIEAYPVFVNNFEDSVDSKPTEKELRDLFDKGKDISRISQPILTEPAFMTPDMADFEFIACDIEKIIEEEKGKIPEELLRSEYDRRAKEKAFDVPLTEEETKALQEKMQQEKQEPKANPDQPATNLPPTIENPGTDEPKEPANPQSSVSATQKTRLVSFQDPAPATEPAAEPAKQEPPKEEQPKEEAKPEGAPQAEVTPVDLPATTPATTPGNPQEPAAPQVPMRTQSFEEVKDMLARQMAAGSAFKVLDERCNEIRETMEVYASEWQAWQRAIAEKDTSMKEPAPLNLQQIADKFGFEYGRTELMDIRTALSKPIGRSRVTRGPRMQPFEFPSLIRVRPTPSQSDNLGNLYVPLQSTALLTRFLFWKRQHEDASTPSYETAKESVMNVWKLQRAAEKADAMAKSIAAKATANSLAEALESETDRNQIVRPTPFTWLNPVVADVDIQLSNVENLKPLDDAFMQKVFSAEPGTTFVAPDAAKEIYYVVKVLSYSPSDEDLMLSFSAAPNTGGVQNVSNLESSSLIRDWFSTIQKQQGFQTKQ